MVGLISDTHGLLRPEARRLLAGSDFIVHGGDVGKPDIVAKLADIAPVTAVRGNVDKGEWAASMPETAVLEVGGGLLIYVLHSVDDLDLDPAAAGFVAVVSGHSHKPEIRRKDGVLYVNPGSARPRRFTLPITVGRLVFDNGAVDASILDIKLSDLA